MIIYLLRKNRDYRNKDIWCKICYIFKRCKNDLKLIDRLGLNHLEVNIAKTQFSFSDTHKLRSMPKNWKLKIKAIRIFAGAGFVVPVAGDILLLPGLPKNQLRIILIQILKAE